LHILPRMHGDRNARVLLDFQSICAMGRRFIGTRHSTFTSYIVRLRFLSLLCQPHIALNTMTI
jgi:hypothetical protein